MIRLCDKNDTERLYHIINQAAVAYEGVIPADRYHQPYMPMEELLAEMERMDFYGWEENGELTGGMGAEFAFEAICNVNAGKGR